MYGVAWQEFDRNNHIVTKTRSFKTEAALTRFIEKVMQKGNLYCILAYR